MNRTEIWKDVVGYEGRYLVSSEGRIKSLGRWVRNPQGERWLVERILRLSSNGVYKTVHLCKDNIVKTALVHKLIMEAFVGPVPKNKEVCHNNGNPVDNNITNLRYGTKSENALDKIKHGYVQPNGSKSGGSKLVENQVYFIKYALDLGIKSKALAKQFGVGRQCISDIRNNRTWTQINLNFWVYNILFINNFDALWFDLKEGD